MSHLSRYVLVVMSLSGCGEDSKASGQERGALKQPEAGECVTPEPIEDAPDASARSCDYSFCGPFEIEQELHVHEPLACHTALAEPCAAQQDQGGFFYGLADGRMRITVGFDNDLGQGEFSDERLTDSLAFVEIYGMRAGDTPTKGVPFRFDLRLDRDALKKSGLVLQDHHLRGTLNQELSRVYYDLQEITPGACIQDDIILDCECRFDNLSIPLTLSLDLALAPG